ncbi:hypothetical protein ACOMHN_047851 [Nucella lapillus]
MMSAADHNMCQLCDSVIELNLKEEQVQCYDCGQWAHRTCAGLSELAKALVDANDSVQWICSNCLTEHLEKRRWFEAQSHKLTKWVEQLTDRIESLEKVCAAAALEKEDEKIADREAVKTCGSEILVRQEQASRFTLTASGMREREETDPAEEKEDNHINVREVDEIMPVLQDEVDEEPGGPEEDTDLKFDLVKCGDQQPAQQPAHAEHPEHSFLRYSRDQLIQVTPAPVTPEVTSLLVSLGISADPSRKQHRSRATGLAHKLKYSRAELLQIVPAPPCPEVISRLLSLGIGRDPPGTQCQGSDAGKDSHELKMAGEGQEAEAMSPPKSGSGAGAGSDDSGFTCLLCETGGLTTQSMEQHLHLYHREQTEEATDDSAMLEKAADYNTVLETSLRLNDGPAEDEEEEEEEVWKQNTVSEGMDIEDDSGADIDYYEEDGGEGVDLGGKSNLSVILSTVEPSQGHPSQMSEVKTGQEAATHHPHLGVGAKPKTKPAATPEWSVGHEARQEPQASGSAVEGGGGSRAYTCPFCAFVTRSEREIQRHMSQLHLDEGKEEEEGGKLGVGRATSTQDVLCLYTCPFCNGGFDTPNDLSRHVDAHHLDEGRGLDSSSTTPQRGWEGLGGPSWAGESDGMGRRGDLLQCPVCGVVMADGSQTTLSVHVNQHFASSVDPPPVAALPDADEDLQMALRLQQEEEKKRQEENNKLKNVQARYGMDNSMTARQQFDQDLEQAVTKGKITTSEFHCQKVARTQSRLSGVDDASTQMTGVVERLRQFYASKSRPRTVMQARLCSSAHHYSGSFGDKGWGCGYRNLQMLLSSLTADPTYLRVLFDGQARVPSILKLQQLIEAAWQKGFDPQGCQQLGGALVNTRKWIGATEIVAMLSSLRIKCHLLDFVKPSGPNNSHPVMIQWVREYFTSRASSPFTSPLYLQHQGHSRTIVGIEELAHGNTNLLLFDPGVSQGRMGQFHGNINYNLLQTIRKTTNAFHARQYQIVAVAGVLSDGEYERSKRIHSERKS